MANTYSAGIVTAYGAAKKAGYTGTYEQFCADQANFARYAQQVREDKESVEQTVETFSETTVPAAVQSVTDEGTTQVGLVTDAGTTAVGNVNDAGTTQVGNVNTAGQTQVGNVNDAGTTQVGNVQSEGDTQVQAVEDKGAEVLASIPADYTELSNAVFDDVTGLDTKAPVILETVSGAIASFDDGADGMPIHKIVAQIEPVQSGTGDPSPDNVRPISGWNEAVLAIAESKIVPDDFAVYQGTITTAGGTQSNAYRLRSGPVEIVGGKTYTVYSNLPYIALRLYSGTTSTSIIPAEDYNTAFQATPFTFTANQDAIIVRFVFSLDTSTQVLITPADFAYLNIFESGKGTQLPINWESEAGTVYGGTVTLNEDGSADLVAKYKSDTYPASSFTKFNENKGYDGWAGIHVLQFSKRSDLKGYNTWSRSNNICSMGELTEEPYTNFGPALIGKVHSAASKTKYIFILSDDRTFAEEQQLLDGLQMVYELGSPVTYHFSNIGQLKTFLGTNNVWCDTGDITELVYPADTKLFLTARDEEITGNIAPVENGTTASQAYAQGAYFWHDTKFCKALTAIASGATFTSGTNYTETTVAAELLAAQN